MLRISFFRFNIRKIQKNSQKGDTTMKKVMALILAACLCMLLLGKAHIGEVQASIWPKEMREQCREHKIYLL